MRVNAGATAPHIFGLRLSRRSDCDASVCLEQSRLHCIGDVSSCIHLKSDCARPGYKGAAAAGKVVSASAVATSAAPAENGRSWQALP